MAEEFPRLKALDVAPEISLLDQDSKPFKLSDYLGQKVIAYFYPAAGSPGCTKEAADFQDSLEDFKKLGFSVVGISPDDVARIKSFQESHELEFALLSDPDFVAHKAFGAFGEKTLYGRKFRGALRSTVIIDEKGQVIDALYSVSSTGHTKALLKLLS